MDKAELILAASHVEGLHISGTTAADEIEILPWIVVKVSATASVAARIGEENAYINVSEKGAWALLRKLAEIMPL